MATNILIVEDAGPDRRRFRTLLDELRKSTAYGNLDYTFAWDAKKKGVKWEMSQDGQKIREAIDGFDFIFLDLAWTKPEEDLMNKARRQSEEWLKNNLRAWKLTPEEPADLQNIEPAGLLKNISGFAFLDAIHGDAGLRKPVAVTTGFYSEAVAKLCRDEWGASAFHKWEDEDKIEAFFISALAQG